MPEKGIIHKRSFDSLEHLVMSWRVIHAAPTLLRPLLLALLLRVTLAPSFSQLLTPALCLSTSLVVFFLYGPIIFFSIPVPLGPIALPVLLSIKLSVSTVSFHATPV